MLETIKQLIQKERVSPRRCSSWFRKASSGHASTALGALRQQSTALVRIDVYVHYAAVGTGDPLILQVGRHEQLKRPHQIDFRYDDVIHVK